jgi:hypothetical protein
MAAASTALSARRRFVTALLAGGREGKLRERARHSN